MGFHNSAAGKAKSVVEKAKSTAGFAKSAAAKAKSLMGFAKSSAAKAKSLTGFAKSSAAKAKSLTQSGHYPERSDSEVLPSALRKVLSAVALVRGDRPGSFRVRSSRRPRRQ